MGKDKVDRFEIGGRMFELRPPVLGQLGNVAVVLAEMVPGGAADGQAVMGALEAHGAVAKFMAAVLVEQGKKPSEMDLEETATHISDTSEGQTARDVVLGFFALPGVAESILAAGAARNILAATVVVSSGGGAESSRTSSEPSSSSLAATSQSGS